MTTNTTMLISIGAMQKGVGYILTVAVAVCLIVAWILTAPLLRWGVWWGDFFRRHFHSGAK